MKNCNKLIERYADIADGDDLVSNFYKDTVVFITGGTGFIGKLLIEKLLRVFSIKRIYLLVRPKNNMTADVRLEKFFEESVRIIIAHSQQFAVILHLLLFFFSTSVHIDVVHLVHLFYLSFTFWSQITTVFVCIGSVCVCFFLLKFVLPCAFFLLLHSRFLIDCEKNHQT